MFLCLSILLHFLRGRKHNIISFKTLMYGRWICVWNLPKILLLYFKVSWPKIWESFTGNDPCWLEAVVECKTVHVFPLRASFLSWTLMLSVRCIWTLSSILCLTVLHLIHQDSRPIISSQYIFWLSSLVIHHFELTCLIPVHHWL